MSAIITEFSQYSSFTALDLITDVMVLDVDVLGAAMFHRILRHLDARLVVFTDDEVRSFFVGSRQNFSQQMMDPLAFLDGQTQCDVLRFTRRQRHT